MSSLTSRSDQSDGYELSHPGPRVGQGAGDSPPDALEAIYENEDAEVGSMSLVGRLNTTSDTLDDDAKTIDGSCVISNPNQRGDDKVSSLEARVRERGGGSQPIGLLTSEAVGVDRGPILSVDQTTVAMVVLMARARPWMGHP